MKQSVSAICRWNYYLKLKRPYLTMIYNLSVKNNFKVIKEILFRERGYNINYNIVQKSKAIVLCFTIVCYVLQYFTKSSE